MANWQYKINLLGVLEKANDDHDLSIHEDPCPEDVKEAIALEISKAPPLKYLANRVKNCKTIAALNRILNRIFDVADVSLVWCGGL